MIVRGRLVEDHIEEWVCDVRVIDGVVANYYKRKKLIYCRDCKHRTHNKTCIRAMKKKSDDGYCDEAEKKDEIYY